MSFMCHRKSSAKHANIAVELFSHIKAHVGSPMSVHPCAYSVSFRRAHGPAATQATQ